MSKEAFIYGDSDPIEKEVFAADSHGPLWVEQTLLKFNPSFWTPNNEHARNYGHNQPSDEKDFDTSKFHQEREVRLLHRDGTSAWNKRVDHIRQNGDNLCDWYVEFPDPINDIVGYRLSKPEFLYRTKVVNTIDNIRTKIATVPLEDALNGLALIEQVKDQKGRVWIVECDTDGSLQKTKTSSSDINITVSKLLQYKFYVDICSYGFSFGFTTFFDGKDPKNALVQINRILASRNIV